MRESRAITIRTIPVISAFCSPERGVRGVEDTLGWGLGADRVALLGVLLDVRALLDGVFWLQSRSWNGWKLSGVLPLSWFLMMLSFCW